MYSTRMNETRVTPQDWAKLPDGAEMPMRMEALEADAIALAIRGLRDLLCAISQIDADDPESLEELLLQAIGEFGKGKNKTDAMGVLISLRKYGGILSPEQIKKFEAYWDSDITLLHGPLPQQAEAIVL